MVSLEKRIIIFYLYLYLYFFFFNFLFLPFNRLETRLCLLKNSKSIIYSSSIHHLIIYSSVLRCLSATLGFDSEFGLVTANFVFTVAKIEVFSVASYKKCA